MEDAAHTLRAGFIITHIHGIKHLLARGAVWKSGSHHLEHLLTLCAALAAQGTFRTGLVSGSASGRGTSAFFGILIRLNCRELALDAFDLLFHLLLTAH